MSNSQRNTKGRLKSWGDRMLSTPRLGKFLGLEFDAHPRLYHEFVDFVLERCGIQRKEMWWWQPTEVASQACQVGYKIQSGEPVVVLRWHGDSIKSLLMSRKPHFDPKFMLSDFQRMKKQQRQDRLEAERKSRAHEKSWISVTRLGESMGLSTSIAGVVTNHALKVAGLQERISGKWRPTVIGHLAATEAEWSRGDVKGVHLLWQVGITKQLMQANGIPADADALVDLYVNANARRNRNVLDKLRSNARHIVARRRKGK